MLLGDSYLKGKWKEKPEGLKGFACMHLAVNNQMWREMTSGQHGARRVFTPEICNNRKLQCD